MVLRALSLPPETLSTCDQCQGATNLRFCSACREKAYCSKDCQARAWPSHKAKCKQIERIDISVFYPFLAIIADKARLCNPELRNHPAFNHRIVNNPGPDSVLNKVLYDLPNGKAANAVVLADTFDMLTAGPTEAWWPSAGSQKIRNKMHARIIREGHVLPLVTSLAFTLMMHFYSSSPIIRLLYRSQIITDFGIVWGAANVKNQDRLVYLYGNDVTLGQDPDDHYWLYFTTAKGEDVLLDIAMYSHNLCILVGSEPYLVEDTNPASPAFFQERVVARNTPGGIYNELNRVSVLRHHGIQTLLQNITDLEDDLATERFQSTIWAFMSSLSRRALTPLDKSEVLSFIGMHDVEFSNLVRTRGWRRFPKADKIPMGIDYDPDEEEDSENKKIRAEMGKLQHKWAVANKAYRANPSDTLAKARMDEAVENMKRCSGRNMDNRLVEIAKKELGLNR